MTSDRRPRLPLGVRSAGGRSTPSSATGLIRLGVLVTALALLVGGRAGADARDDPEYIIDVWETDQGLPENSATAMVQTPDGHLWFGTFNGLVRFDGVRFTVFDRSNTPQLPSAAIVNLHLDRAGRLWISTDRGLVVVEGGRWTTIDRAAGWTGDYVRFFADGAHGELYLTSFDRKLFRADGSKVQAIPTPMLEDEHRRGAILTVDGGGRVWLTHHRFIGEWADGRWESRIAPSPANPEDVGAGRGRDGSLWVLDRRRLAKYVDGSRVFETAPPFPLRGFWSLQEDSAGHIWICSFMSGLYRFTPRDGRWRHFTMESGLSYNSVRFVFEDRESNLWVGTSGGGLLRFKRRTFSTWGTAQGLSERVVKSVSEDRQGQIVVGTYGAGATRLDGTPIFTGTWSGKTYVHAALVDRRNRLWLGMVDRGLVSPEGPVPGIVPRPVADPERWTVYSLFEDSRGRIWAGGDQGAVVLTDGGAASFELPGTSVRSFAEDPSTGAMWLGTHSAGLHRIDEGRLRVPPEVAAVSADGISTLHADQDGTLLIGTVDRGLAVLAGGRLVRLAEAHGLPARGIGAIVDDGLGYFWLGTNRGVFRVARADLHAVISGRRSTLDGHVFTLSDGLPSLECSIGSQPTAVRDREGRIWFATLKGVARTDPRSLRLNDQPPPVLIDELRVDGRPSSGLSHRPFDAMPRTIVVPPGASRIEIGYTALSFTAPEKVRFRYRLEDLDQDWIDVGSRRVVYLQDLSPGSYRFSVKAANNDGLWNETGDVLALTVRPFWWQTLWFRIAAFTGFMTVVGLTAWQVSRARMRRHVEALEHRQALEQERARLASILEATSDCVTFADPAGHILYVNPAGRRLLGLDETASLRTVTFVDLHPAWAAEIVVKEGIPYALRDGIWSGETALRDRSGAEIPVSQVIVAHRTPGGTVEFLSTIARDISDRIRTEERLRDSEERLRQSQKMEAIGRLAGGIAHDFNNLLTVITGYTSFLLAQHESDDADYEMLTECHRAGERASALTRQLLAFSRRQLLVPAVLDLNGVVAGMERMLGSLIPEHITRRTILSHEPCIVKADRGQLEQVILNLAVNARDAMPHGGQLTVESSHVTRDEEARLDNPEIPPGQYVVLAVSDTGCGMDRTVRESIFEPFFTTKGPQAGTGLGLATVYGIVTQSGGHIAVESEVGRGSTFRIYLPRVEQVPNAVAGVGEAPAIPQGKEVVLLVEDEGGVRAVARQMLQQQGYTVLEASNGANALRVSAEYPSRIDLLVTDVVMPEMNGRVLVERLAVTRPELRVLYVSGYTDDAILREGVIEADVTFLQKPFTVDALARKVRQVLDGGKTVERS
jgi:PAS domain S-box-containing protein